MTSGKGVAAEIADGAIDVPRPGWLPGADETEGPPIDLDALPPDEAFEILRNPRRRHALRILSGRGGVMGLTDLASEVASIENDKPPDAVSTAERKRVYISLYQCHVSKMVEGGIIEYDEDARLVEITSRGVELAEVLESFGRDTGDKAFLFPGVATVAFGLSIATFYGSMVAVATLFLGVGLSFTVFSYLSAGG